MLCVSFFGDMSIIQRLWTDLKKSGTRVCSSLPGTVRYGRWETQNSRLFEIVYSVYWEPLWGRGGCTFGKLIIDCLHCCHTQLFGNVCYWWGRSNKRPFEIIIYLLTSLFLRQWKTKMKNPCEKLSEKSCWRNISNTRNNVSSDIQTPRRELKIRRAAEYFWRNSRCLDSRWNSDSSVWYIFSIETRTKEKTEK